MAVTRGEHVVLMFSGGRDSSLAALRLHEAGHQLTLVTVTAGHLYGLDNVERRLRELTARLSGETEWLQVVQPALRGSQHYFHQQTCLPCQSAYVVTAANIARRVGTRHIAFGYAKYQAAWPEQGPAATRVLRTTLAHCGFELMLPVYDIDSREAAKDELRQRGLSDFALEQKCLRQVTNVELTGASLIQQVDLWGKAIATELRDERLLIEVPMRRRLKDLA